MDLNWMSFFITMFATFIGGLAGSWFASKATQNQTTTTVRLNKEMWLKERAFEFLLIIDEYVGYSFHKDANLNNGERNVLSRKLLTHCDLFLPDDFKEVNDYVWEIRKIHSNQKCKYQYPEVDSFFRKLSEKINHQYLNKV